MEKQKKKALWTGNGPGGGPPIWCWLLAAVLLLLFLCILASYQKPVIMLVDPPSVSSSSPVQSQPPQEQELWEYPSRSLIRNITVDDFDLIDDGTFLLYSNSSYETGAPLSIGYLEECMTLYPAAKFTVEQLPTEYPYMQTFRIHVENGQSLPATRVRFALPKPGEYELDDVEKTYELNIAPHFSCRLPAASIPIERPIELRFNEPVDFTNVEEKLKIAPAFDFTANGGWEKPFYHTSGVAAI